MLILIVPLVIRTKLASHFCCVNCNSRLYRWFAGKNVSLGFSVPMVWREQKDHLTDCYFRLTNVQGQSHKTRKNIQYPDLPSAIRLVRHSFDFLIPMPRASLPILDEESLTCSESSGADFKPCQTMILFGIKIFQKVKVNFWDHACSSGTYFLSEQKLAFIVKRLSVYLTFLQMVSIAIVMIFLHGLKALVEIMTQMTGDF